MDTVEATSTQTAVVGTPATLFTAGSQKTRVLRVSLRNMVTGDVVEVRVNDAVIAGGPIELIELYSFTGAQTKPHMQSFAFLMFHGGTFVLTQTAGTARTFDWEVAY